MTTAQRFVGGRGLVGFNDAVRGSLVDQRIEVQDATTFRATLVDTVLGDVRLVRARVGPLRSRRKAGPTRRGDGCFLLASTAADGVIRHRGGIDRIAPRRLVVIPGDQSFDVDHRVASSLVFVVLPDAALARWPRLTGPIRSLPMTGAAASTGRRLRDLAAAAGAAQDVDELTDLGQLLDVTLRLAVRGGAGVAHTAAPPTALLRVDALRAVDARLEDPDLSVASVARALHVSRRTLQRAFEEHDGTLAEEIRDRRLDAALAALRADRRLGVGQAAARFGFSSASHLARWCRRRHGQAPNELRGRPV